MLRKTLDAFGKVDILVNNAGGLPDNMMPSFNHGYVLNLTVEDWKAEIELNLNSLFYCCKIVGEAMVRRPPGNIINISSAMGMSPFPDLTLQPQRGPGSSTSPKPWPSNGRRTTSGSTACPFFCGNPFDVKRL